jgi:environmental stress-induced protein Ves
VNEVAAKEIPMSLQRFAVDSLPATPWKNGGGVTREIVCWPLGAGLDTFDWRISIASIAAAGPFSAFPGIARTIMLLDGAGVRLHSLGGVIDHRLATPLEPFSFSGDVALDCDLLGGASTDFNVMVRHERLHSELRVLRSAGVCGTSPHGLLLAQDGAWTVCMHGHEEPLILAPGDGVWWAGEPQGARLTPNSPDAALIEVRFEPAR